MPNRIIKESIRTSRSLNGLTDFQFRFWVHLLTYVDDYGRGSADPEILKGFVFPRRQKVTAATIRDSLTQLANKGIVHLYTVDDEPYFCFPAWSEHQRVRQKISKFPAPTPEFDSLPQPAATCGIPPRPAATCGDLRRPAARIQNPESGIQNPLSPLPPTGESGSVADAGFEQFWSAYPRRETKQAALKVWKRLNPDTDLIGCILEAIARRKQTDQWLRENGRFVPKPDKWLRDRRWEDVVQTQQEVKQLGDNLCQPTPVPPTLEGFKTIDDCASEPGCWWSDEPADTDTDAG